MEKRGTTETSCIARASNLEVLGMDLCTSILGITIPNPDEMELPEFVQSIPTSVGDELATDGTQNIYLPFCILWWNGIRCAPGKPSHFADQAQKQFSSWWICRSRDYRLWDSSAERCRAFVESSRTAGFGYRTKRQYGKSIV